MWRGVAAESALVSNELREGWPLGSTEALVFLKRRGVLLGDRLGRTTRRGSADSGTESYRRADPAGGLRRGQDQLDAQGRQFEEIQQVNLLPHSVRVHRRQSGGARRHQAALPDMRVMGAESHISWRRILLWSPETQVPAITTESASPNRDDQAGAARESAAQAPEPPEFLASLAVRVTLIEIRRRRIRISRARSN